MPGVVGEGLRVASIKLPSLGRGCSEFMSHSSGLNERFHERMILCCTLVELRTPCVPLPQTSSQAGGQTGVFTSERSGAVQIPLSNVGHRGTPCAPLPQSRLRTEKSSRFVAYVFDGEYALGAMDNEHPDIRLLAITRERPADQPAWG